jgi:hypothetical protein
VNRGLARPSAGALDHATALDLLASGPRLRDILDCITSSLEELMPTAAARAWAFAYCSPVP